MTAESSSSQAHREPPVIAFTSGKGGAGKTTLAVNFADVLSRAGHKILLVDLDLSNRGSTGMLSSWTKEAHEKVTACRLLRDDLKLSGECRQLMRIHENLMFCPAGSCGEPVWCPPDRADLQEFVGMLRGRLLELARQCGAACIVLDCFCGIDLITTAAAAAADHTILVNEPDIITFTGSTNLLFHLFDEFKKLDRKPHLHIAINRVKYTNSVAELSEVYQNNLEKVVNEAIICYFPYHPRIFETFGTFPFVSQLLPRSLFVKKLKLLAYFLFKGSHDELIPADARHWSQRTVRKIYVRTIDPSAVNAEYLVLKLTRFPLYFGIWLALLMLIFGCFALSPVTLLIINSIFVVAFYALTVTTVVHGFWLGARLNFSLGALRYRLSQLRPEGAGRWRLQLGAAASAGAGVMMTLTVAALAIGIAYSAADFVDARYHLELMEKRAPTTFANRRLQNALNINLLRLVDARRSTIEGMNFPECRFVTPDLAAQVPYFELKGPRVLIGRTRFVRCAFDQDSFSAGAVWRDCAFDDCDLGGAEGQTVLYIASNRFENVTFTNFPRRAAIVFQHADFRGVRLAASPGSRLGFLQCTFTDTELANRSGAAVVLYADSTEGLKTDGDFEVSTREKFFGPFNQAKLQGAIAEIQKSLNELEPADVDYRRVLSNLIEQYILMDDDQHLTLARKRCEELKDLSNKANDSVGLGEALMLKVLLCIMEKNGDEMYKSREEWLRWLDKNPRVVWDWQVWNKTLPRWQLTARQLEEIQNVENLAKGGSTYAEAPNAAIQQLPFPRSSLKK